MRYAEPRRSTIMRTAVFAAVLVTSALGACAAPGAIERQAQAAPVPAGSERAANVAIVRTFLDEVVNKGRFELVDQLWAPDMVWRGGSQGEVHGRDVYRRMLEASVGGSFTNMRLEILDIIADGDKVVVRFTNSGDQTGPFAGHPATGRHAVWEGIGVYRIENGRIAEAWFSEDWLGMFQQLGFTDSSAH